MSIPASLRDKPSSGGDAKSAAETVLEDAAFVLARALANHFKKTGALDRHGKVNVRKTRIVTLRKQNPRTRPRPFAIWSPVAVGEAGAAGRGVTGARVAALSAAITGFAKVMNLPRGQIVNRGALLKEVDTDVAGLVENVSDMDDLAIQFDASESGLRFLEAWKRARFIVDTGGGHTPPTPPLTPPPA